VGLLPREDAADGEPVTVPMWRTGQVGVLAQGEMPRAPRRGQTVKRETVIAWHAFWLTWAIALGVVFSRLLIAISRG
jgi:hypothetical protein